MQPDVLLGDGVGDGVHRGAHHVLIDRADAADAQRVDLRQFAGVEHEAFLPHAVIELLEVVVRILRRVKVTITGAWWRGSRKSLKPSRVMPSISTSQFLR